MGTTTRALFVALALACCLACRARPTPGGLGPDGLAGGRGEASPPSSIEAEQPTATAAAERAALERNRRQPAFWGIAQKTYQSYGHRPLPDAFPARVRALVPNVEHKMLRYELRDQMDLTLPAPGRLVAEVMLTSMAGPTAIENALLARLQAAGWRGQGDPLESPVVGPGAERLLWKVEAAPDQPTRLTLTYIDRVAPAAPNLAIWGEPLPPGAELAPIVGAEYGLYHSVGRSRKVDLHRFAIAYHAADSQGAVDLAARLEAAARNAGFVSDEKGGGLKSVDLGALAQTRFFAVKTGKPSAADVLLFYRREIELER